MKNRNSAYFFTFLAALQLLINSQESSLTKEHLNSRILQQTETYVTTNARGPTVRNQCGHTSRQNLFVEYGSNRTISHSSTVSEFFDFDPRSFIEYALDEEWDQFQDELNSEGGKWFVFLGAWIIGLGITVLIWPFLLVCMCSHNRKWFTCKCCVKNDEEMPYSKYERVWPVVTSIILGLVILTTAIIGVASGYKVNQGYHDVACSGGIFIDNLVNGNTSLKDETVFFTGMRTLDTELRELNQNKAQLDEQILRLTSTNVQIVVTNAQIDTTKLSTERVPSLSGAQASLTYLTPLESANPNSLINSSFSTTLGTFNQTDTLVGSAYRSLTQYEDTVSQTSVSADSYTANIPEYTAVISEVLRETNRTALQIEQEDVELNDFFEKNEDTLNDFQIGEYIVYGFLILVSLLVVLALCGLTWFEISGCRFVLYMMWVMVILLAIVTFAYTIFISFLNPIAYYICEYAQMNLENKTLLESNLMEHFNIEESVARNVSECIAADGNGQLVKNTIGEEVWSTLAFLNRTYLNLTEVTQLQSEIPQKHQYLLSNTTQYKTAKILDIVEQSAVQQLERLSFSNEYQECGQQTPEFNSDSWIPSLNQNYIPCQVSSGRSDSTTCQTSLGFSNFSDGCVGCMDTYSLFQNNVTVSQVRLALDSRYPSVACSNFNEELSNVWGNFYNRKTTVIGPIQNRAALALQQADQAAQNFETFNDVKAEIDSGFSDLVTPQFGVLSGLNCQIVREDALLLKAVFCENTFTYTYFARVVFGIISFSLLFLICCLSCVIKRDKKQRKYKYDRIHNYRPQGSMGDKNKVQDNLPTNERFIGNNYEPKQLQHYNHVNNQPYYFNGDVNRNYGPYN